MYINWKEKQKKRGNYRKKTTKTTKQNRQNKYIKKNRVGLLVSVAQKISRNYRQKRKKKSLKKRRQKPEAITKINISWKIMFLHHAAMDNNIVAEL